MNYFSNKLGTRQLRRIRDSIHDTGTLPEEIAEIAIINSLNLHHHYERSEAISQSIPILISWGIASSLTVFATYYLDHHQKNKGWKHWPRNKFTPVITWKLWRFTFLMPFVVSPSAPLRTGQSNHERPFDKLRANGLDSVFVVMTDEYTPACTPQPPDIDILHIFSRSFQK